MTLQDMGILERNKVSSIFNVGVFKCPQNKSPEVVELTTTTLVCCQCRRVTFSILRYQLYKAKRCLRNWQRWTHELRWHRQPLRVLIWDLTDQGGPVTVSGEIGNERIENTRTCLVLLR